MLSKGNHIIEDYRELLKHRRYTNNKEPNAIQNLGLEDFSKSFIEVDQDREEEKLVVRIIGFASGEVR